MLRAQRPTCSVIQRPARLAHLQACRGDSGIFFGPGPHRADRFGTIEPSFVPDEARRVPIDRQINEFYLWSIRRGGRWIRTGGNLGWSEGTPRGRESDLGADPPRREYLHRQV
jgi:hypothetical protein